MYLGRIVEQGPVTRVFASPRHPYTAMLRDADQCGVAQLGPQQFHDRGLAVIAEAAQRIVEDDGHVTAALADHGAHGKAHQHRDLLLCAERQSAENFRRRSGAVQARDGEVLAEFDLGLREHVMQEGLEVAAQRRVTMALNKALVAKLTGRGMTFDQPDIATFKAKLAGGFYPRWKQQVGAKAWTLLEKTSGRIG
jgi:ABC-type glutathione transport system ATPase component